MARSLRLFSWRFMCAPAWEERTAVCASITALQDPCVALHNNVAVTVNLVTTNFGPGARASSAIPTTWYFCGSMYSACNDNRSPCYA